MPLADARMRSPLEPSVVYDFGLLENKNEKAAFAHYMEGAVRSDAAMQFRVALGYRAGRGAPRVDPVESFRWMCKAASAGYKEAQFELVRCHARGLGTPVDLSAALSWSLKWKTRGALAPASTSQASPCDRAPARGPLAHAPLPADPPATDPPATDPPATDPPATDPPATDPPATDPPATTPPPTALSESEGARREEGVAPKVFFNVGLRMLQARDLAAATRCFRLAAARAHAPSQFNLGLLLLKEDPRGAKKWLRESASRGFHRAHFVLGMCGLAESGSLSEPGRLAQFYRDACDRQAGAWPKYTRAPPGRASRARCARKLAAAAARFQKAAAAGHAPACFALAELHVARGQASEGRRWFARAAAHGHGEAASRAGAFSGGDARGDGANS